MILWNTKANKVQKRRGKRVRKVRNILCRMGMLCTFCLTCSRSFISSREIEIPKKATDVSGFFHLIKGLPDHCLCVYIALSSILVSSVCNSAIACCRRWLATIAANSVIGISLKSFISLSRYLQCFRVLPEASYQPDGADCAAPAERQ